MSTDTNNLVWGPLENFRTLLANCDSYRLFADTTTGTEAEQIEAAKETIYNPMAPSGNIGPWAIVCQGPDREINRRSSTGYDHNGTIGLVLRAPVPAEWLDDDADTPAESVAKAAGAEKWFLSHVGDIIDEVLDLGCQAGFLNVASARQLDAPERSAPQDVANLGDFYQVLYEIKWGVE